DRRVLLLSGKQLQLRAAPARRRREGWNVAPDCARRNRRRPARAQRALSAPMNTHERRNEVNGYRDLRVALLGCGSVGSQVARLILEHNDELAARIGARLTLTGIAVRDTSVEREAPLPEELFTTDAESLVLGADVVVELMGGIEPARSLIAKALQAGADVVTANKALIAAHGPELADVAEQVGAQLSYEAAVAGAIPIIRPLRESLAGDHVTRVLGIVNGSTNYILDRM